MPHVRILLCSFNGAAFLEAQLASLSAQDHRRWGLWVSDDGSTDGTADILARFRGPDGTPPVVRAGPGTGFAANFLSLLAAPDLPEGWVALCDQDDVWFPDKLSRALAGLAGVPADVPGLACGRTVLTDAALRPLGPSRRHRHFAFRNALVQNVVAGNTIVLNPAAHRLVRAAGPVAVPYHDWWLYLLVTAAGGRVVYDPEPCLQYRQHGGNQLGENRSALAVMRRGASFGSRRWRGWFDANIAALQAHRPLLAPEARAALDALSARDRGTVLGRTRALAAVRPFRQYPHETAALYVGSLLGLA